MLDYIYSLIYFEGVLKFDAHEFSSFVTAKIKDLWKKDMLSRCYGLRVVVFYALSIVSNID